MKILNLLICLFGAAALLSAKEEQAFLVERKPVPSIDEAIRLVREHDAKQPNAKPIFVDLATYERRSDGSVWKIGVRYEAQETGHLIYAVDRNGSVKIDSVVKDG